MLQGGNFTFRFTSWYKCKNAKLFLHGISVREEVFAWTWTVALQIFGSTVCHTGIAGSSEPAVVTTHAAQSSAVWAVFLRCCREACCLSACQDLKKASQTWSWRAARRAEDFSHAGWYYIFSFPVKQKLYLTKVKKHTLLSMQTKAFSPFFTKVVDLYNQKGINIFGLVYLNSIF